MATDTRPRPDSTVLVVDDDQGIRDSLRMAFTYEGYDVVTAVNGAEGLDRIGEDEVDLVVADVMMPVVDGLSMCRVLRRGGDRTPILVLTAKAAVRERVDGLDAGADDYLVKPFDLDELLARARALLRRTRPEDSAERLAVGDLTLDVGSRSATRAGHHIELTKTEFELLRLLMANRGIVLTRQVIYERIWGYDLSGSSRSLDVYISYLRNKTEIDGLPRLIHTVRGTGFTIRAPE